MKTSNPDLLEKVCAYAVEHAMFAPGQTVLVAVSGGPDSVCLLDLLNRSRARLGISLHVAHLDHGLRGRASRNDARFVRRLADKMNLPCEVGVSDVKALAKSEGRSLEDAARQSRYRFLEEVSGRVGASRVALGHTRSDQAETVLLRLVRGSGATGLAAIRPVRDARYVRPLLEVSREEVENYLRFRGLRFCKDLTNLDLRFTRNRLRRDLLPRLRLDYNPDVEGALARAATLLSAEDDWLEEQAGRALSKSRQLAPSGKIVLDVNRVLGYHLALRRRVIRKALEETGCEGDSLGFGGVERLVKALGGHPVAFQVSEEVSASCDGSSLILSRRVLPFDIPVRIPGRTRILPLGLVLSARIRSVADVEPLVHSAGPFDAFLDLRALDPGVSLRNPRKGDRIHPLGGSGSRKVSDLLIDARVPRPLRDSVPILAQGSTVHWVAGHRIANQARVTAATERVVHFRIHRARRGG